VLASEDRQPNSAEFIILYGWQQNEGRFIALEILACKYLSVPVTSAPSERVFFLAENVCCQRRARPCGRSLCSSAQTL